MLRLDFASAFAGGGVLFFRENGLWNLGGLSDFWRISLAFYGRDTFYGRKGLISLGTPLETDLFLG